MSSVRQEYATVNIGGRSYEIALTLAVIDRLQDRYGSLDEAFAATAKADGFLTVFLELVNDNIDLHNEEHPGDPWKPLTKAYLSRQITVDNLAEVNAALLKAFHYSIPDADGASGNAAAGQ